MSKFHFDEPAMSEVAASLSSASGIISIEHLLLLAKLSNNKTQNGFGIESSLFALQDVLNCDAKLIEKISAGAENIKYICQRVSQYSEFASDNKRMDTSDYINQNSVKGNYLTPFNYYSASHILEKYFGGGFVVSQVWDALLNTFFDGGYEKKVIYDTIRSTIDGLNPRNEIPNSISNILDKYELTQINTQVDIKDNFLDQLSKEKGYSNIVKYMKEVKFDCDIIKIIASDYSINLEYLDSVERNLKKAGMDTKILNEIMSSMRNDYENKYIYALKQFVKKGTTTIVDAALETNTIGKIVLGIKTWSERAFTIEDGGKARDSKKTFAAITTYYNNISESLDTMGDKIASGNYTLQDLDDFSNMFEISKSLRVKQFQAALDFVDKSDLEYCNEAIAYYSGLSMDI